MAMRLWANVGNISTVEGRPPIIGGHQFSLFK